MGTRGYRPAAPGKTAATLMVLLAAALALVVRPAAAQGGKILYVDSYHIEYAWSADITKGVRSVLAGRDDIELRVVRMDTKRNKSEDFKKKAALKVKKIIDQWRPDVVIASDDNAAKYLIVPYYLGGDLPFVFCGLNWDASVYGFPAKNVTGMVEVSLFKPLLDVLRGFARGPRVGYLASDVITERKELANIRKRYPMDMEVRFVKSFAELRAAFRELQRLTDMVVISECRSVRGFDHQDMVAFARENTLVPTGATQRFISQYALVTFSRIGEEQGEYAARTALAILDGASPADFPVVTNKKARIYLNMPLAKKLGIKFPVEMIAGAHLISAEQKKLLYVNSYHRGYQWSDDIERGLLKALDISERPDGTYDTSRSEVRLRVYRMDTKRHQSEAYKRAAARAAKEIIDEWRPDVVLTSDDAAAKYLIAPYFINTGPPFVFCGVNWSAREYGLPARNVTGMVEVSPVKETVATMRPFAAGDRLGYIAADNSTNRKNLRKLKDQLGLVFADGAMVGDFNEWRRQYVRLQDEVDMLLWLTTSVAPGWDEDEARRVILTKTKIPSGSVSDHQARYTLLGRVKIGAEQGWWMGKTALKILEGVSPADIPVTTNTRTLLFLNMELAKRLEIKFPMDMIERAVFVGERVEPGSRP